MITNINNQSQESHTYFQKCKDQFQDMNQSLLNQELEVVNIKIKIKEVIDSKFEEMQCHFKNTNTQITSILENQQDNKLQVDDAH